MKFYKRHGDINIYTVDEHKENLEKVNKVILAEGETTGHLHTVLTNNITKMKAKYLPDGRVAFSLGDNAELTHPEHGTLELEKGNYISVREREVDIFSQATRRVID